MLCSVLLILFKLVVIFVYTLSITAVLKVFPTFEMKKVCLLLNGGCDNIFPQNILQLVI